MNKILLPLLFLLLSFSNAFSQESKSLKKILELKIPREGGANGAQVVWHPLQQKYYAAMAGNASFCLAVFSDAGTLLSPSTQETLFDIRGLWYNPSTRSIQMNGYDDYGWGEYLLNSTGLPTDVKELQEGLHQPDAQSSGAFDSREKVVYFISEDGNIEKYDFEMGEYRELIELALGKTKESDKDNTFSKSNYDVFEDYNSTTLIYTGIRGAEIGLLNHYKKQVELYNITTGYMTRKLLFPTDAPANTILNFAYTNGVYWLFDKENRVWKGYK